MATRTLEEIEQWIEDHGCVVALGQFDARVRRQLEKQVREGRLAKWRAHWNAPFGGFGIGPLKTIYGRPELNPFAEQVPA